jgi:hypothetical protein
MRSPHEHDHKGDEMSDLTYHASLARVDDLLREAAGWRLGNEESLRSEALPSSMHLRKQRLRLGRLRRVLRTPRRAQRA